MAASVEWTLTIVGLIHEYACRRSFQFLCPAHIVFALRQKNPPLDFLFRNAPAVLCIQAPDPLDGGLAASAIEMVGTTLGIGVLYNGYLRRCIASNDEAQRYLDMDLEEKPLVACMLLGYSDVVYQRSAPRRNPSVVLR